MEANAAQHASEIILDLGLQEAWVHRHCFFFRLSRKSVGDSRTQACLMSVERPHRFPLETDSPFLDK